MSARRSSREGAPEDERLTPLGVAGAVCGLGTATVVMPVAFLAGLFVEVWPAVAWLLDGRVGMALLWALLIGPMAGLLAGAAVGLALMLVVGLLGALAGAVSIPFTRR